jgi:histidinol phosphatase-like PHP family hydrolase
MNIHRLTIILFFLSFVHIYSASAQTASTGEPLKEGLFKLNEIDLHVHAGKERQIPLNDWIDLFIKDGRKVLLLLDHLELYRLNEAEHKEWIAKEKLTDWYPNLTSGNHDFMKDMTEAKKREDILLFKGWEIWEGEMDEGLEKEPMKDADVIGWHMSKAAWNGKAPKGKELIHRAKQIIEVQKEFHVPMIIFHPFAGHFKEVQQEAVKSGRSISSIKKEEYRYFTPDEQKELIKTLNGTSVYIEIERGWSSLWNDPTIREAFIEDIRPLVEGGIKFTVSTDAHKKSSFKEPFNPEQYCQDLGINPQNVNTIIRELLAIQAKKNIK